MGCSRRCSFVLILLIVLTPIRAAIAGEPVEPPAARLAALETAIRSKKPLAAFMSAKGVTFTYNTDARDSGTTKGQLRNVTRKALDGIVPVRVFTDGKGWYGKEKPHHHVVKFNLRKTLDRLIRLQDQSDGAPPSAEKDLQKLTLTYSYIQTWVTFHLAKQDGGLFVHKVEYVSQDPG